MPTGLNDKKRSAPSEPGLTTEEEAPPSQIGFPVVGVGASAGGLEAFRAFLTALPENPGCAFVFIQHLSPKHESLMADILDKMTPLDVVEASDDTELAANCVYVIPPDRNIRIENGAIVLDRQIEQQGLRLPIDYFFRSLAEQQRERAIAVVLTGTGSDGSEGVREVKAAGGLVLVQDPEEAQYDGMPRSAIKTQSVDFVEPIDKMHECIIGFVRHPYVNRKSKADDQRPAQDIDASPVVALLKARTDFDFTAYKQGTLRRRIQRRMSLRQLKSVDEYLDQLRDDPSEIGALRKDLLITVTRFFRDSEVWDAARRQIAELVADAANADRELRIWAPGCATGEEAYSIAILIQEEIRKLNRRVRFQIFATDLDEDAISSAREGRYPKNIEQDVPESIRQRYFERNNNEYRIVKFLREHVVFAPHNLVGDPPFSGLDLISCRNLLIYIEPETQTRILEMFHFALRPGGLLILGSSESLGHSAQLYSAISQENRIFRRAPTTRANKTIFPISSRSSDESRQSGEKIPALRQRESLTEIARRILIARYGPPTVLVTSDGEARYFHGSVQKFLELPEGEPTSNISEMAAPGLKLRLKNALRKAKQSGDVVRAEALRVERSTGTPLNIRIDVEPIRDSVTAEQLFLVSFVELDDEDIHVERGNLTDAASAEIDESSEFVRQLEYELQSTREDLQTTIEELETANEELKASNEEAMSTNEELQSTNEELETSREELQSLNEELVTVNAQLEEKVGELERSNDDLANLLTSVEIAVLFLGRDLRIKRFTPPATDIFSIIDSDIDRPVSDLTSKVDDETFADDAREVLRTLSSKAASIRSTDGERWYQRRIRPYRTADDRIEGVVVTFSDVTELKESVVRLERRERQQSMVADLGRRALSIDSVKGFFDIASETLAHEFGYDCVKILRFDHDTNEFEVVSGTGWSDGVVGKERVPGAAHSQAGFTMLHQNPVIVQDTGEETRFEIPDLLQRHEIRSGISCAIGRDDDIWGVIGIHCKRVEPFSAQDGAFIQAIANVVYESILRINREEALARAQETLRMTLDAAELGVWRWVVAEDVVYWDQNVRSIFGLDGDEPLDYEKFLSFVHPDDREDAEQAVRTVIDEDGQYKDDYRIIRPNGEILSVVTRGDIVHVDGEKVLVGVLYDVTKQKTLERQYELIARELDHRVKNLLATVVSMSRMMSPQASSVEEFKASFHSRITSLANTHALLADAKWRGATIEDLILSELAPYASEGRSNVKLDGPNVVMEPHAAQCLSMAFHELATNAAKYGALSDRAGRITVEWRFANNETEQILIIEWRELDGPPISEPTRAGFGTKVLNELLEHQLSAAVELSYEKKGFRGTFKIPAKENIANASLPRADIADLGGLATRRSRPSEKRLTGLTILVVDDEWFVANAIADTLQRSGANVPTPAASIEKARALIDETDADIAVLDFNIAGRPVVPIMELLRERSTPFVIISGYGSGLKLPEAFRTAPVLSKPVVEDRLIDAILHRFGEAQKKDE